MKINKFLKVVSGVTLGLTLMATTAFAHGSGHHGSSGSGYSYATCNVANCTNKYNHTHNGRYYSAHNTNDGHRYHR